MTWLAERAAGSGLEVNLEVVNRYETNVVNTTADMLTLIEETGADIGVHLDSYHVNIEEDGFAAPVHEASAAGRLGYVHLGESHRGYMGTGTVDFDTLCQPFGRWSTPARWSSRASAASSYTPPCPTRWPSGATCGTTGRSWRATPMRS